MPAYYCSSSPVVYKNVMISNPSARCDTLGEVEHGIIHCFPTHDRQPCNVTVFATENDFLNTNAPFQDTDQCPSFWVRSLLLENDDHRQVSQRRHLHQPERRSKDEGLSERQKEGLVTPALSLVFGIVRATYKGCLKLLWLVAVLISLVRPTLVTRKR